VSFSRHVSRLATVELKSRSLYELQNALRVFLENHLRTPIEWIRKDISLTPGLMVRGRINTFTVVQNGRSGGPSNYINKLPRSNIGGDSSSLERPSES
jgi:hypothetical protein